MHLWRQVLLTRWDLFHAHCFCTPEERGLGLLFHAKEYPSQDERAFPFNLGYCQRNSPLAFDGRAMDLRNLVYFPGTSLCLAVMVYHALYMSTLAVGTGRVQCYDTGQ